MVDGNYVWLIWAALATFGWGGAYTFLRPMVGMSPMVLQILFGVATSVFNLIALAIWSSVSSTSIKTPWDALLISPNAPCVIGYVVLSAAAGLSYLYASKQPNVNLSVLTSLTAAYPLVTTLIMFAVYQEYEKLDLRYAVPGLALTTTGCILLGLATK